MTGADPDPQFRDTVPRAVGDRLARLAILAVIVGFMIVVIARQGGDDDAPGQAGPTPTQPAASVSAGQGAGAGVAPPGPIAVGTASNGAAWILAFGDPAASLCLTVAVVGTEETRFKCEPLPDADSAPAGKAYQPMRHSDPAIPPYLFGRLPPGVTEVEVIVADGGTLGRMPAVAGFRGSFYAVELTGGVEPIAVFGYQADGTSVRFELPR